VSAVNTIPKYRAMVSKLTAEESSVAGMRASQGPTLSGCTIASKTELTLHFNESLLGAGEKTGAAFFLFPCPCVCPGKSSSCFT
jgi:hypothetical protein